MQQGLELIARNFNSSGAEIELTICDTKLMAFIETRYHRIDRFGGAIYNVVVTKQRKLKRCVTLFIIRQKARPHHPCRFDVIAYDAPNGDGTRVDSRCLRLTQNQRL